MPSAKLVPALEELEHRRGGVRILSFGDGPEDNLEMSGTFELLRDSRVMAGWWERALLELSC